MNISDIVTNRLASSYLTGSAAVGSSAAVMNKPLERLGRESESTQVKLSAFGQVKSAAEQTRTAANALREGDKLATADDVKKAVTSFVSAVNNEQGAIRRVSSGEMDSTGRAGPVDGRLRNVGTGLRRALQGPGGGNESDLGNMGITLASDGSMKVDTKKLEQAFAANPDKVKEVLSRVGSGVAEASSRQLSNQGYVGGSVNRLNQRLDSLAQNQALYQSSMQQANNAGAVNAYREVYSF